jgi:hypothetical protein
MEIKYDTPVEVNERQYNASMRLLSGIVAGRIENGKYYIKIWFMKYVPYLTQILNSLQS